MSPDPPRVRTVTWEDPEGLAASAGACSGLEFLTRLADGRLPGPPIVELFGFTLREVESGRVVFTAEPAEWMYNPIGSVHGGVAATLLDTCMGCAVHSTLEAGAGYTTTDLHIRYHRGMSTDTGRVLAQGVVTHRGRRQVTAEGQIVVEATGKLIATGTTGCMLL